MAKLRSFQEAISDALGVPFARVRTVAAALRVSRLLTTGPRGPGAPEMAPSDATNLLLGLMYDDEVSSCAENVRRLRDANFNRSWRHDRGEFAKSGVELPPHRFFRDCENEPVTLGFVLDTMFDWWARYGTLEENSPDGSDELCAINVRLSVTRPGYVGSLHIDAYNTLWDVDYEWKSAEQKAYEAAADKWATRWDALQGPQMTSTRQISEVSFWKISDCLRGFEFPDGVDEVVPAYDKLPERETTADANSTLEECA